MFYQIFFYEATIINAQWKNIFENPHEEPSMPCKSITLQSSSDQSPVHFDCSAGVKIRHFHSNKCSCFYRVTTSKQPLHDDCLEVVSLEKSDYMACALCGITVILYDVRHVSLVKLHRISSLAFGRDSRHDDTICRKLKKKERTGAIDGRDF